jgi:hypothetical protein
VRSGDTVGEYYSLSQDEYVVNENWQAETSADQHILAETTNYTERELLMENIKEHREARQHERPVTPSPDLRDSELSAEDLKPIEAASPRLLPQTPRPPTNDQLLIEEASDLTSLDIPRVRYAFRSSFIDIWLTPYLMPLLARDEVAEDARMELRWLVPRIIGQLTDALLDSDLPLLVRQRLPGLLEVCHNPRAVNALLPGLADSEFNVRYACARTLARMKVRNRDIEIAGHTVFEAVRLDVDVAPGISSSHVLTIDTTLPVDVAREAGSGMEKLNRSLEHVITVFNLSLDGDALRLALQAIHSKDRNLRGAALEYLENVLPDDIREALWRHIGVTRPAPGSGRNRTALVGELQKGVDPD